MAGRDFPRTWKWNDDGDTLEGVLTGLRWVDSKQNPGETIPVLTVQRENEAVSVWVSGGLRRRMEDHSPRYGDTLRITRGALVPFGNEGREYREWEIVCDRAAGSYVDLAGRALPNPNEAEPVAAGVDDSDIPF